MRAGDPVSVRLVPEADEIVVTAPDGSRSSYRPGSQELSFAGTSQLGVYRAQQMSKGKAVGEPEEFAVNLFSREEAIIAPQPNLVFAGTKQGQPAVSSQQEVEIWPWVLLASLVLLMAEWWFYNRAGISGRKLKRQGTQT